MNVINTLKEGALQCSLCLELLQDPRILGCLHRFCRHCLDDLCLKGQTLPGYVTCPLCREKTAVPAGGAKILKSDFLLRDILEKVQMNEDNLAVSGECGSCTITGELAKFCRNCQCVICPACVTQHEKMKILQTHALVPISSAGNIATSSTNEEVQRTPSKESKKCPLHCDETLYYQCTNCENVMICNTCLNSTHRGHQIKSLDDVMSDLTKSIRKEVARLLEMTDLDREAVKVIGSKRREVHELVDRGKIAVANTSQEMIDSIREQSKRLALQLEEKETMLDSALSLMEEAVQMDLARSADINRKAERCLSQTTADAPTVSAGSQYLSELRNMLSSMHKNLPDVDWIKRQQVRFNRSFATEPAIGNISCQNSWVLRTSWDVGLIHEAKDAITGMVTLPSGKLLLAISREKQATYIIISSRDGSLGWRKNVALSNTPPFPPCFATALDRNTIIMACHRVITRYQMSTNAATSYGMKMPPGAVIQSIAADEIDECIIASHSAQNELCLFDGELNDTRKTTVGEGDRRITKIVSQAVTKSYLLCDDQGAAFAVDKHTGTTETTFPPPRGPKTVNFLAKAICGSGDGDVFVLWSSPEVAHVVQYLSNGIPVSRIDVESGATLITITSRNDVEYLIVCRPRGSFSIYSKS